MHLTMRAYWFVDIALDKRCYRCHKVIAKSEADARRQLRQEDRWIACVGCRTTRSATRSRRTFLDRNRVPECAAKLGVTQTQLDQLLHEANVRLGIIVLQNRPARCITEA
jgi:hypothetical protein